MRSRKPAHPAIVDVETFTEGRLATPRGNRTYHRCAARNIVPGSPVLETHSKNVYLPERAVLNKWIGRLFAPEHRDETVDQLLESAGATGADSARAAQAKKTVTDAGDEAAATSDAIKASANPVALVDAINEAQAELEAAQAEQARQPVGAR